MTNHERYDARKAAGLCVQCGTPMPEGCETVLCPRCRERSRANMRYSYQKRRRQKLCVKCGDIAKEGYSMCPACLRFNREYQNRYEKQGRGSKTQGGKSGGEDKP